MTSSRAAVAWPVLLAALTTVFWVYGLAVESPFTWFYIPLTYGYSVILWAAARHWRFSSALIVALFAAALGNLTGGVLIVGDQFYMQQLVGPVRFDDVQHAYATGVVAWACWWILGSDGSRPPARIGAALLMAAGLGTLIEMVEFLGSTLLDTNVGGYEDAMFDLVSNALGAIAAAVVLSLRRD